MGMDGPFTFCSSRRSRPSFWSRPSLGHPLAAAVAAELFLHQIPMRTRSSWAVVCRCWTRMDRPLRQPLGVVGTSVVGPPVSKIKHSTKIHCIFSHHPRIAASIPTQMAISVRDKTSAWDAPPVAPDSRPIAAALHSGRFGPAVLAGAGRL